jgi:maltose O-acetyltransferase
MSLWLKCLQRWDRYSASLQSAWYRRRFVLFEQPKHRLVELGAGVQFNVPIRGGTGSLRIGANTMFGYREAYRIGSGEIMLQTRGEGAEIVVGANTGFNNNVVICATQSIRIGERCLIADGVAVYDSDFHELNPATRHTSAGVSAPVVIGNNVWLGSRAIILKGVTIGDNSVIGTMSLVTKDIPSNTVAAGIPAKVIRTLE